MKEHYKIIDIYIYEAEILVWLIALRKARRIWFVQIALFNCEIILPLFHQMCIWLGCNLKSVLAKWKTKIRNKSLHFHLISLAIMVNLVRVSIPVNNLNRILVYFQYLLVSNFFLCFNYFWKLCFFGGKLLVLQFFFIIFFKI